MKTLIILAHPDLDNSITNRALINEASKYPDKFIVHNIGEEAKNFEFNVKKEQELLEAANNIVLQFPVRWFNTTPILKKWFDDVFLYGWAYGSNGDKLKGKKFAMAVTMGTKEEEYTKTGIVGQTIEELLSPLIVTFKYVGAEYTGSFKFFGAPLSKDSIDESRMKKATIDYIGFLNNLK